MHGLPSFSPRQLLHFRSYDPTQGRELAFFIATGLSKWLFLFFAWFKDNLRHVRQSSPHQHFWASPGYVAFCNCYVLGVYRMESRCNQSPSRVHWKNATLQGELIKSTLMLVLYGSFLSLELFKNTSTYFEHFWINCCFISVSLTFPTACVSFFKARMSFVSYLSLRSSHCLIHIQKVFIIIKMDNLLIHQNSM